MKKVYCKNCKHYSESYVNSLYFSYTPERCWCPKNEEEKDTYKSRDKYFKWTPGEKNKNNKCPYYEEEELKTGLIKKLLSKLKQL